MTVAENFGTKLSYQATPALIFFNSKNLSHIQLKQCSYKAPVGLPYIFKCPLSKCNVKMLKCPEF